MTDRVSTPGYWVEDAIRNLQHAAKLADKPDTSRFADLKATVFAAWQAIRIAEDLGAQMLEPIAGYIAEEAQCSPTY